MRITPLQDDRVTVKTTSTKSDYVVWRRWEDCLWFQDMLEIEYSMKAREKRARLFAGKGVKKNGLYTHDHASSFESLPPGPDPKSVSKDIHDYLPKLNKKGTLFRPSQATVALRHREFAALIDALFGEDVPALIAELRKERIIRDFFGHWRRDHDLAAKHKANRALVTQSLSAGAFSTYFSASNVSLSLPGTYPDVPTTPAPAPSTHSIERSESSSSLSLSDTDMSFFFPKAPSSAPARLRTFDQSQTITEEPRLASKSSSASTPALSSTPPRTPAIPPKSVRRSASATKQSDRKDEFTIEEFPLFLTSETREGLNLSGKPIAQANARPIPLRSGLASLPEEQELGSTLSYGENESESLPPSSLRSRYTSLAKGDPANRNCVLFVESTDGLATLGEAVNPDPISPATSEPYPDGFDMSPPTSSSRPPSLVMSSFSVQSSSSWYSTESAPRSRPGSPHSIISNDLDLPFVEGPSYPITPASADMFPVSAGPFPRLSTISMDSYQGVSIPERSIKRRSISPGPPLSPSTGSSVSSGSRRPRSYSQPLPMHEEQPWSDLGEDFIQSYLDNSSVLESIADSDSFEFTASRPQTPTPSERPPSPDPSSNANSDVIPSPSSRRQQIAMYLTPERLPRSRSYQDRPAGQFHFPLPPPRPSPSQPLPDPPQFPPPLPSVPSPHLRSYPSPPDDTLVVKAALGDAIVVFRTPRAGSLADLRLRVHNKFSRQEGITPPEPFVLAYLPPLMPGARSRMSSMSSASSADLAKMLPLVSEEEWSRAIATCGPKLVLRIVEVSEEE